MTPLLYTLKINQDRFQVIKSDIEYSQTSESDDEGHTEHSVHDDLSYYPQETNLSFNKKSTTNIRSKEPSKKVNINRSLHIESPAKIKKETMGGNFVIQEEAEFSGEEVNVSQKQVQGSNFNNFRPSEMMNFNQENENKHQSPLTSKQVNRNKIQFELREDINNIPKAPRNNANSDVSRRESKSSQIVKLFEKDVKNTNVAENPILKVKAHSDSSKERSRRQETAPKKPLINTDTPNLVNTHKMFAKENHSSLNSSMNEGEYLKNFQELVEEVDKIIHERRKLKIVPYSK